MIKLNARNCKINKIDKITEENFLKENHLQSYVRSYVALGLYYNGELVQLMTFGKPRFNKSYSWELLRDCTKKDYQVIGGTSKLWKYFIENYRVASCICYSYPHNEDSLYTNKYVDYCGFVNIKKAKPAIKIYFEGLWDGEYKRIDKSVLEMQGVDRLLKGSFGQDRTNEQILLDLGFKKKEEEGFSPQVDSFFPEGIVYKITDLDTGKFYIGETFYRNDFLKEKYNGSGSKWLEYYNKYRDVHKFKREVLKDDFKAPGELYKYEEEIIRKYCKKLENGNYQVDKSTGCMNTKTVEQSEMPVCPECGAPLFHHKKSCSNYTEPKGCEICGRKNGQHKKDCPNAKFCPECGGRNGHHKKHCTNTIKCSECGEVNMHHKSTCSQFKLNIPCSECGSIGRHKKTCSKSQWHKNICQECGLGNGRHKSTCSKFNTKNICSECGGINNQHKKICSKFKHNKACPECGSLTTHKPTCSKYKLSSVCSECGGKRGHHTNTCSKFVSHYKCLECGLIGKHSKNCSYNKCEECGNPIKSHKSTCSKYKKLICSECGGKNNVHKKECSQYKEHKLAKSCPECGSVRSHKSTCSKYKRKPCDECGVVSGRHKKGCSKYKKSIVCSKCGGRNGHHYKTCTLK